MATAPVAKDGRFEIGLSPGRYTITGSSPAYLNGRKNACHALQAAELKAGATATVLVVCQEK